MKKRDVIKLFVDYKEVSYDDWLMISGLKLSGYIKDYMMQSKINQKPFIGKILSITLNNGKIVSFL